MYQTVTQFSKSLKQPFGGYLPIKTFNKTEYSSETALTPYDCENIHASLVGMSVDYLTRWQSGFELIHSFEKSLIGAVLANQGNYAIKLMRSIYYADEPTSIDAACKLVGFDVMYRTGVLTKPVETIQPDSDTIKNIKEMVNRSMSYFNTIGEIELCGYSFDGAHEKSIISNGDGDYLTEECLIDMKVSIKAPTSKDTLQILVYYILGLNSIYHTNFQSIKWLCLFNPRLNIEYKIHIDNIQDQIAEIKKILYPI